MREFHPARDPVVWTFIALLASTVLFSVIGAFQNHRIALEIREAQRFNHEQLSYLRQAFEKREAELEVERKLKAASKP